jgi:hypothetical protein
VTRDRPRCGAIHRNRRYVEKTVSNRDFAVLIGLQI